ncbi:hypothetical protein [Streptomyces sp. NPDC058657]|uniref:hypothetical protein n=1 Tax=unclassified Streptomyces TaxID=2593676 RepID=UPI00365B2DF5
MAASSPAPASSPAYDTCPIPGTRPAGVPPPPARARQVLPHLALWAVLGLLWLVALRLPWLGDLGQHAAAVERLRRDLSDPGGPLLARPGSDSPYYTPYTVVAALYARVTGAATLSVLSVCAAVNAVVLVAGVRAFVRTLTPRPWAPFLTFCCLGLLWGPEPFLWSGFLSLSGLCLSLSYPSTFAFGLGLYVWARLDGAVRTGRGPVHWAGTGLLLGCVVLINPVVALGVLIGCAAVCAGAAPGIGRRTLTGWAAGGAAALLLVVLWPYGNVLSVQDASALDFFHETAYHRKPLRYGLVCAALPALLLRMRRSRRDPLVLLCAGALAVAAAGWFTGHYTWGRVLAFAVFAPQCALAVELAAPHPWAAVGPRTRRLVRAGVAAALCAGLWAQSGALLYALPELRKRPTLTRLVQFTPPWGKFGSLTRHLAYGDVVLTTHYKWLRVLPAYGVYTVAPAWPQPEIPRSEAAQRWNDTVRALSARTGEGQRRAVLCRWQADWLILTPAQPIPTGPEFRVIATGPDKARLVRVTFRC